jgi:hypothetical protein
MSEIQCSACGLSFDGRSLAWCPACLAARWLATPELVRPKHDPAAATSRLDTYRSLVTPRLKSDLREVLRDAAVRGRWFLDRDYRMWVHVTSRPLGRAPGVGVPAGSTEPEHALDCLFIAEADSADHAHVFAADGERHEAQVRARLFEPLGVCSSSGCENLRSPGRADCDAHRESVAEPAPSTDTSG